MSKSVTIVIPNRNRDLNTVRRSIASIVPQLNDTTRLVIVDYGSDIDYQHKFKALLEESFPKIYFILCPTQGQLFHKTRAINMVLRDCTATFFMVLDMDCIAHPEFIEKALILASENEVINFPYGFLKEEESKSLKAFSDYHIDFIGGLTGTAIFNTEKLQTINGFDEFYHSWGAEDADMFDRLERIGVQTNLYKKDVLLLHQWHAKGYRDKKSKQPFHSYLEKVNHEYYTLSRKRNTTKVNLDDQWGLACDPAAYTRLKEPTEIWEFENYQQEIIGLFASLIVQPPENPVEIRITKVLKNNKDKIKKILNKKTKPVLDMDLVNDRLLETIILHYRNRPYFYEYDTDLAVIKVLI
ncbi:glycosyltransferase family 2 protein [Nonlabens sp. Asnod2-A12]|uniref:glycosyltransferase family 2 protein n=1 Tax=Nonlabens sp. Asnod2-A12 TaxID=3160578 RepID=UPI0038688C63